jgi:hypothetical protein
VVEVQLICLDDIIDLFFGVNSSGDSFVLVSGRGLFSEIKIKHSNGLSKVFAVTVDTGAMKEYGHR